MPIEDSNTADISADVELLNSSPALTTDVVEPEVKAPKVKAPVVVDDGVEDEDNDEEVIPENEDEVEAEDEPKEILPHERPTIEAIKKEFPEIFKKFPSLKDAFFREKQFSEVFHTPAEARNAATVVEDYNSLRDDVVNGNGEKLLPALKESDSLEKFSKSFLPNLYKIDKDAHWKVILPVLEDVVRASFNEGNRTKNDDLKHAAMHIAQFLLGDMSIAEGKNSLVEKEQPENNKVKEERQAFENERYNTFNIDVHEQIYNDLTKSIDKGFKEEDGLTDFMKKSIRSEILAKVVSTVKADVAHTRYLDKLWKEAKANGFRGDDKSRIINASLARAQSLIPGLRRQLIGEALGSSPLEGQKRKEKVEVTNSRREPGSSGRNSDPKARVPAAKQIDWSKTSDMDILNGTFTTKGQK